MFLTMDGCIEVAVITMLCVNFESSLAAGYMCWRFLHPVYTQSMCLCKQCV